MLTKQALFDWLAEPSTARGFAGLLFSAGLLDANQVNHLMVWATTLLSLIELIRRETARNIGQPPPPR